MWRGDVQHKQKFRLEGKKTLRRPTICFKSDWPEVLPSSGRGRVGAVVGCAGRSHLKAFWLPRADSGSVGETFVFGVSTEGGTSG